MGFLLVLAIVASLGSIICWIIVLTKLFPAEGVGKGILAIICALYAFIWGWQKKDEHGIQTVMMVWSVLVVLGIILNIVTSAGSY
jgi:hypothetical protein